VSVVFQYWTVAVNYTGLNDADATRLEDIAMPFKLKTFTADGIYPEHMTIMQVVLEIEASLAFFSFPGSEAI
jgi:hypothetical protein